MANIKSQIKRNKTNEKARIRNISYKSKFRTAMKKVRVACEAKNIEEANKSLVLAVSLLDRAVVKGILAKGTAARYKSNLQSLVNSINK